MQFTNIKWIVKMLNYQGICNSNVCKSEFKIEKKLWYRCSFAYETNC